MGIHSSRCPDSWHQKRMSGEREGSYRQFLSRDERAVGRAIHGSDSIETLTPQLHKWTIDPRNLRCAWEHLERHGGQAPGPNGLSYSDLENHEIWGLMRVLKDALQQDKYRTGPERLVRIHKGGNRGYRTLRLQNIQDRVVHRGVVQIIQPLLDPTFDDDSDGFRPGRDRRDALAKALHYTECDDRFVWVAHSERSTRKSKLAKARSHNDLRDLLIALGDRDRNANGGNPARCGRRDMCRQGRIRS